jgi:hypothetical protein
MMSFASGTAERASRRILIAMIVAGAMLTGVSFAMQIGPGTVKSRLHGLMGGPTPTEASQR